LVGGILITLYGHNGVLLGVPSFQFSYSIVKVCIFGVFLFWRLY